MDKLNFKHFTLSLLALSFSVFIPQSSSYAFVTDDAAVPVHESSSKKIVEAIAATGYKFIHKVYDTFKSYANAVKTYITDVVADETVDAIVLVITPYAYINSLPPIEKEEMQRKQARLFKIRDRVLQQLHSHMDNPDESFSSTHKANILSYIGHAEVFCKAFDSMRHTNPYEKEYETASFLDSYVEKSIVESIILSSKPDEECSAKELKEKSVLQARSDKIMKKLGLRVKGMVINNIKATGLFFAKLFI